MSTTTSNQREERKCFIITPIGDSSSDIRRHIDGIIDAAIIPALEKNNSIKYKPIVPHRIYNSTTITKQIYNELYECDLVIANLTELNPNVMYELAICFCFGKPVIIIAEIGTKLPFDIKDQRVFFYTNDAQGTIELIENISKSLETINYDDEPSSPIHDAINEAVLFKIGEKSNDKNQAEEKLALIIRKLDGYFEIQSISEEFSTKFDILLDIMRELEKGSPKPWMLENFKKAYTEALEICVKAKSYLGEGTYEGLQKQLSEINRRYAKLK